MSHSFHEALRGFDPGQILVDGCAECEHRSSDLHVALSYLDDQRFANAWRRAYDHHASDGRATGRISNAEAPLLTLLWDLQVVLQRFGIPLNGAVPHGWLA